MTATFDPDAPFGPHYAVLNAYPEPMALTVVLPPGHVWWRRMDTFKRDVPGVQIGGCVRRVDPSRGWEPGNVRVAEVPTDQEPARERERDLYLIRMLGTQNTIDFRPQSSRREEWTLKVLSGRMKRYPGRPVRGLTAFFMRKRIEDWAGDAGISVSTIRRKLRQGIVLEDIILEAIAKQHPRDR